MKDLNGIIQDIRSKLKSGSYENEQHIRISLVTYICYGLGWNIWNPSEFYTEFTVDKTQLVADCNGSRGKVDIALFKNSKKKNESLYALIETKTIGMINQASRTQLKSYSVALNHPISILTDGIIWEFYLNSLPNTSGQYQDRMINMIDLKSDDLNDLCILFESLLHNSVTPAAVTTLGKKMRQDFFIIQNISIVKQQVETQYPGDVPKQLHEAYKTINTSHGKKVVRLEDISRLWSTKIALGGVKGANEEPGMGHGFSQGVVITRIKNYTGMSLKEISIKGGKAVPVTNLAQMKKIVYDHILANNPNFCINQQGPRIQDTKDGFTIPLMLNDGRYTEGSLSFNGAVDHCRRALKEAGFLDTDLIIGYTKPKKRKA